MQIAVPTQPDAVDVDAVSVNLTGALQPHECASTGNIPAATRGNIISPGIDPSKSFLSPKALRDGRAQGETAWQVPGTLILLPRALPMRIFVIDLQHLQVRFHVGLSCCKYEHARGVLSNARCQCESLRSTCSTSECDA